MRILWELAIVAVSAIGFAFIGGVIGGMVVPIYEVAGIVKYSWYGD